MRILFLGLNYSPEMIGIAVYSSGMCEWLAAAGHEVDAVVAKPYYPQWRAFDGYRRGWWKSTVENDVSVVRCPIYVPKSPTGLRRIVHHLTFAFSAFFPMVARAFKKRPDIVITVAPSIMGAPVASFCAKLVGAKSWLHIQDFEVDAGFATGLMKSGGLSARLARAFETSVVRSFDRVSSISFEMCGKAESLLGPHDTVTEFRNWARIEQVRPLDRPSVLRKNWAISRPCVALYSGNIANKQGIEIVVQAAKILQHRTDLIFIVCGQGPHRMKLEQLAQGLANIQFHDLQPIEYLNELLGLATVHLLPQTEGAADLVLPSKLTNMLASGRPVIATAAPGTGLAREVESCGLVSPPGDAPAFASAIVRIIDDPMLRGELGTRARARAETSWNRSMILDSFVDELEDLLASTQSARAKTGARRREPPEGASR